MIDQDLIEWLQNVRFEQRMRGYDREQVDGFVQALVERLEVEAVEGELASAGSELLGVGEKVEEILRAAAATADAARTEAAEQATKLRREAEAEAEEQRSEAGEYAERTRRETDDYASSTRRDAEREAERLRTEAETESSGQIAAAEEEAARILRDAERERERIEESLEELRERRRMIVANLERLRGSLGTMVGEAEQGTKEWAALSEEDRASALVAEESDVEFEQELVDVLGEENESEARLGDEEEDRDFVLEEDTAAAFADFEQDEEDEGSPETGEEERDRFAADRDDDEEDDNSATTGEPDEDPFATDPGLDEEGGVAVDADPTRVLDVEELDQGDGDPPGDESSLDRDTEAWSIEDLEEEDEPLSAAEEGPDTAEMERRNRD